MSDGSLDRNDLVEGDDKAPYETPEFSVVALSVITLGGSIGLTDTGGSGPQTETTTGNNSNDDYDEDPLDDDPWGGRGGG